jgi:hypothetical protein
MHKEEQAEAADGERDGGGVALGNVSEVEYPGRPPVIVRTTRLIGPDLGPEGSPPSSSRRSDSPD